jgi:hypothetical protein
MPYTKNELRKPLTDNIKFTEFIYITYYLYQNNKKLQATTKYKIILQKIHIVKYTNYVAVVTL